MSIDLTPTQLAAIGLVALCLAQFIKLLASQAGVVLTRVHISWIVMVVSVASAAVLNLDALRVTLNLESPLDTITALLGLSSGIFGVATFVYNVLLQQVFEKLGWLPENPTQTVEPPL